MRGVRNFTDIPAEVRRRVEGDERVALIFLDAFGLEFLERHGDHRRDHLPASVQLDRL